MSHRLSPTAAHLFASLKRSLGADAAALELRWMKQALAGQCDPSADARPSLDLERMLERRMRSEPLQYILGTQPFGPLNLRVRAPVLIPRPETEDWAMRLAGLLSPSRDNPVSILDLCTGTGCIPLLLCRLLPPGSAHAYGVDISDAAIGLARENAALSDIAVLQDGPLAPADYPKWSRNTFRPLWADIRAPNFVAKSGLHPPFSVITSNPPYIPKQQYDELPPSVKDYEDRRALLGDPEGVAGDGLSFYHTIAELLGCKSGGLLETHGIVALEVGEGQANAVAQILEQKAQLRDIEIWRDPWEKDRVVVGKNHR